jgi:hypothetical protein
MDHFIDSCTDAIYDAFYNVFVVTSRIQSIKYGIIKEVVRQSFGQVFIVSTPNIELVKLILAHAIPIAINCMYIDDTLIIANDIRRCVTFVTSNLDEYLLDLVEDEYSNQTQSAICIQRQWRRAIVDPGFLVCRRRLKYEFNHLLSVP